MLVTEASDATRAALQAHARSKGVSDLMVPAEVMIVDKLPLLGTGKIDLVAVASLVRERPSAPENVLTAAASESTGSPSSRAAV